MPIRQPTRLVEAEPRMGVVDIIRVLGGLVLLNALLSWWWTSTGTWGYEGRRVDPRYWAFQVYGLPVNFTLTELSRFDGSDPRTPIYLAVNQSVYDVTASRSVYGPGGSYAFFAGKDAARAYSTGCFGKADELTYDLRGLDRQKALADIEGWQRFFATHRRYWYVGVVQHPPLVGEPPSVCDSGVQYPFKHAQKGGKK